jgi:hypothetical protein
VSVSWFILPYDPKAWEDPDDLSPKPTTNLRIDPKLYETALRERWPKAEIHGPAQGSRMVLTWRLPVPPEMEGNFSGLRGDLHDDCQVISFGRGPNENFFGFIMFHRSFVPQDFHLFLLNSSYFDRLELKQDTTEEDIIQFTGFLGP